MEFNIILFVVAVILILYSGPKLSKAADILGKKTGMGQTIAGALFLGATTSLPGLIVSFKTAIDGQADIAISNSIGGVAAQTLFIGIADAALRKGHLSHKNKVAASLLQTAVLIALLTLVLLAMTIVDVTIWHIHLLSPVIFIVIIVGFRMVKRSSRDPQWIIQESVDAEKKEEELYGRKKYKGPLSKVIRKYIINLLIIGTGGWLISYTGSNIVAETGISPVIMGATFMAIASSLPELVTAVASVRHGLVGLAIGNIVGGNTLDTIMVVIADMAYTEGSIFEALSLQVTFLTVITLLMTSTLLIGLIRREKIGLANIGVESYLIMIIYAAALFYIFMG